VTLAAGALALLLALPAEASPTPTVSPTPTPSASPTTGGEGYLTVNSTSGGWVEEPGEGVFWLGGLFPLEAVAEPGCSFVNWTHDIYVFCETCANTTGYMTAGNYSITANFVCGGPTPTCTPPAVYDRLSGNLAGAWNSSTDFTYPWSATGSQAANTSQMDALSTIDENWYRTDIAGDGGYNYQMYNVTVDTPAGDIQEMTVYWAGWGEGFTDGDDHPTTAWVWNGSGWELMQDRDDVTGTSGFDKRITSNFSSYINASDGNSVYIKAMAEHEEVGICCPYVFGWDGGSYKFIDAAITHSFLERYEETTYDVAAFIQPKDGCYDLICYGPFMDEWHINSLGLKAVEHPAGTRVAAGFDGEPVVVSLPRAVTAVDSYGRDVTALLEEQDGRWWSSDLSGKDFDDTGQLHDWIELTLPDRPGEGTAKLLVDIRVTELSDLKLWLYTHYLLGSPSNEYLIDRMESDEGFIPCVDYTAWLTAAPRVQYWDGEQWLDVEDAPPVPAAGWNFGSPMVFPLELGEMQGDRVRIAGR